MRTPRHFPQYYLRLFTVVLFAISTFCHAESYSGIVAFGDSLTDMGNRWIAPGKTDIKFRRTWVVQLAGPSMLNLPGLQPSGVSSFYGGSNYAVGGAGTDVTAQAASDRNRSQHLTEQISNRYLNSRFNPEGAKREALHTIVIGANDLMLASIGLDQILTQWTELNKVGIAVAKSTEGQIQVLASAGVTNVLWGNIFDVAQAPSVVAKAKSLGGALAPTYLAALTKAAQAHNQEMEAAIERLTKANPSLKIIKLDLFSRFAEVAADPAKFGFSSVTTGANDNKHLFSADGLHPTSQGHKMLAEYAFSVLTKALGKSQVSKTTNSALTPKADEL